jgi:general secretion pathway protein G
MFTTRSMRPDDGPAGQRGISYLEVLVACFVLVVVAMAAIPTLHWNEKRLREKQLRISLETMRTAIDQYKKYVDEGLIVQEDVEQMGYPLDLEELVDGVEITQLDPGSLEAQTVKFLFEVPVDPFTGERDWGLRSYQDDWDANDWGGENVWDVYSLSPLVALDGTYYSEW